MARKSGLFWVVYTCRTSQVYAVQETVTLSETICQNCVNTYLIPEQNCRLVPRCEARYMKDILSFRGSSLWERGGGGGVVNYNDKEAAASPNSNDLRRRVSAGNYFKDFKFDCTSASTTRYRQVNFVYC